MQTSVLQPLRTDRFGHVVPGHHALWGGVVVPDVLGGTMRNDQHGIQLTSKPWRHSLTRLAVPIWAGPRADPTLLERVTARLCASLLA